MSNLTLYDEPRPEMDEMLGDFFQSQIPKPWPAFKVPKLTTRKTPSLWSRYGSRIALAACVTLLIAGYWSLSGDTVSHQPTHLEIVGPSRASKDKGGKAPNVHDDSANPHSLPVGPNPKAK